MTPNLIKLAERFETKIAQTKSQTKSQTKPPAQISHQPVNKQPLTDDMVDVVSSVQYISGSLAGVFRGMGIDINSGKSRDAMNYDQGKILIEKLKTMMPNIQSVMDRLETILSKPEGKAPYEPTTI